jgi:hypothetical protein
MKLNIEAAAKKLAEIRDYPWEYMPREGQQAMTRDAEAVVKAALSLVEDKPKCKDYGHAGPKCGADDCWLRNE